MAPSWPIWPALGENVLENYFPLILTQSNENLTEILLILSDMQYGAVWPIGPKCPGTWVK